MNRLIEHLNKVPLTEYEAMDNGGVEKVTEIATFVILSIVSFPNVFSSLCSSFCFYSNKSLKSRDTHFYVKLLL